MNKGGGVWGEGEKLAGETPYAAVEKNEHDNYAKLQSVADICHPRISFNK